jgi:hypothetical protein
VCFRDSDFAAENERLDIISSDTGANWNCTQYPFNVSLGFGQNSIGYTQQIPDDFLISYFFNSTGASFNDIFYLDGLNEVYQGALVCAINRRKPLAPRSNQRA